MGEIGGLLYVTPTAGKRPVAVFCVRHDGKILKLALHRTAPPGTHCRTHITTTLRSIGGGQQSAGARRDPVGLARTMHMLGREPSEPTRGRGCRGRLPPTVPQPRERVHGPVREIERWLAVGAR